MMPRRVIAAAKYRNLIEAEHTPDQVQSKSSRINMAHDSREDCRVLRANISNRTVEALWQPCIQLSDINMNTDAHTAADVPRLPLNLLDPLRALEMSGTLTGALGEEFTRANIRLRRVQWDDYSRHLTQWERDTTLDI